jgi:hypothetical protein
MPDYLYFFTGFPGGLVAGTQRCFNLTWLGPSFTSDSWNSSSGSSSSNICNQENDFCVRQWVVTSKHRMSLISVAPFNACGVGFQILAITQKTEKGKAIPLLA